MNNLESLVPGIPLDIILQHLDLASYTNLRLTSRRLATTTIHRRFFRCAKTDLSLTSLQSLADRVSHPQLGPLLRELTVVATLYDTQPAEATVQTRKKWSSFDTNRLSYRRMEDLRIRNVPCTDEEIEQAQQDLEWMQTKIQQDTDTDISQVTRLLSSILEDAVNLRGINLGACIIAGRTETCQPAEHHKWYRCASRKASWPSVWTAASQTFRIVTSSISRSKIQLEKLQIFPDTLLCSVQLRHVEDHLRTLGGGGLAEPWKNIQSFGLSFSTHEPIETPPDQRECLFRHAFAATNRFRLTQHVESDAEDFTGAATILRFMPNLESLDLHLHHLDHILLPEYTRAFTHVSQDIRLGSLRKLSLHGLSLRPDDLILFLTNHPTITKLSLNGILLIGGSWSSVFSCIETMPALESLHLRSLRTERHEATNLEPLERNFEADLQDMEKWVLCGNEYILYTRDLCREEIQRGLDFRPQPENRDIWVHDNMWPYWDRLDREFGAPWRTWEWNAFDEDMS
ncbi:f-box domain-containing protein [Fusarium pseudoanthophilum]|uniref:F-box domain-containing protein n=1 Tax=Fusarium pseudoanthophilum TaxID=48495 RepID=A0A8H5NY39_9HYPO|nr:f-box domain-containing protein [Fusarium pseudoanthophilum]